MTQHATLHHATTARMPVSEIHALLAEHGDSPSYDDDEPETRVTCPRCKGEGTVTRVLRIIGRDHIVASACDACAGGGTLPKSKAEEIVEHA